MPRIPPKDANTAPAPKSAKMIVFIVQRNFLPLVLLIPVKMTNIVPKPAKDAHLSSSASFEVVEYNLVPMNYSLGRPSGKPNLTKITM